jgi:O-antigen/teichoic acid export membrane protein
MGIIAKQSIYNSIASYLGILVGAVNTIILFPNVFSADEFGLTRVLGAASIMIASFGSIGIPNVTLKFFPFFRDKENKHHGFLFFILMVPLFGYAFLMGLSYVFKEDIIGYYSDQSTLFGDYFNYIPLLTIYLVYFNVFDAYLRSLYKTVIYVFLQNVVLRFLWMILIILYYFDFLNFDEFMFYYVNVYAILLLVEIVYTAYINELHVFPQFKKFDQKILKKILVFGVFVILGASSGMVSGTIDSLMIGALTENGLAQVGYYSIAMYVGIMIMIPYRSIIRIATPIISEAWKTDDTEKIDKIYKQTSTNLMIIGSLLFLGIWTNVDNIFKILPEEYGVAKYVLLFLCIAKLYDVSTGVNATIIQFSKFFKLMLYFNVLLILLLVATNLVLIPLYGIEGAALATLLSIFIVNTIRLVLIKVKMGIIPFTSKSVLIPVFGLCSFLSVNFIPPFESYIVDIAIRSFIMGGVFVVPIYLLKVSDEFNALIDKTLTVMRLKSK